MAETFFMIDRTTGHCALFEEAPGPIDGDYTRDDPRNIPLLDPEGWIHLVHFHTLLDNLEVSHDITKRIAHVAVGKKTGAKVLATVSGERVIYNAYRNTNKLMDHNLGYIPWFKVRVGNSSISAAYPIQAMTGGRARWVSVWSDTKSIWVSEIVDASSVETPAISIDYRVMVFRKPPDPTRDINGRVFPSFEDIGGLIKMSGGRFNADLRYAQVVAGGTPFSVSLQRTMDAKEGAPRIARPDGTVYDQYGSAGLKMTLVKGQPYGSPVKYTGTFTTGQLALIQAP